MGGYANIHSWTAMLGLQAINTELSVLLLCGLGVWVYVHRRADVWVLLGVSAVVARFWTYHRLYDDLLLLPPMIALWRVAQRGETTRHRDLLAGVLFVMAWLGLLAPARFLATDLLWGYLMVGWQVVTWMLILGFLMYEAHRFLRLQRASL